MHSESDSTSCKSDLAFGAGLAFRYALFFTGGLLLLALLLDGVRRLFALGRPVDWQLGFGCALILGILFGFQFTVIYSRLRTYSRVGARIQGEQTRNQPLGETPYGQRPHLTCARY